MIERARSGTVVRLLERPENERVLVHVQGENGPRYGTLDYATRETVTVGGMRIPFDRIESIETHYGLVLFDARRR